MTGSTPCIICCAVLHCTAAAQSSSLSAMLYCTAAVHLCLDHGRGWAAGRPAVALRQQRAQRLLEGCIPPGPGSAASGASPWASREGVAEAEEGSAARCRRGRMRSIWCRSHAGPQQESKCCCVCCCTQCCCGFARCSCAGQYDADWGARHALAPPEAGPHPVPGQGGSSGSGTADVAGPGGAAGSCCGGCRSTCTHRR